MKKSMKVESHAYQVIEKIVRSSGNSGRVYVPKNWIGKPVRVILLESAPDSERKKVIKHEET